MDSFTRLMTELICWSKGFEPVEIKDNLAIDSNGGLIQEVYVRAVAKAEIIEITVGLTIEKPT